MSLFDLALTYAWFMLLFTDPVCTIGASLQNILYILGYIALRIMYEDHKEKKEAKEEREGLEKIRKRNEEYDLYYKAEKKRRREAGCSLKSAEDEDIAIYSSWPMR